jgi:hypothetical protein
MVRVHVTNGYMDRVRPGILRPYITQEDWIHFANDVDTSVWPILRFIGLRSIIPAVGFPCFLLGLIMFMKDCWDASSLYDDGGGGGSDDLGFMICIASIGYMILGMTVLNLYRAMCLEPQVKHSLENIVLQPYFSNNDDDDDDDNQGGHRLTAHWIQQQQQHQYDAAVIVYHGGGGGGGDDGGGYHGTHYDHQNQNRHVLTGNYVLEISILDDDDHQHPHKEQQKSSSSDHCLEDQHQQQTRPKETTTTTTILPSALTVRQRLERLEQLRDALSHEEYQERRWIILDVL